MDQTLTRVTVTAATLAGSTTGCGTSAQVESLYIGGWIFLALIFIAMVVLLGLIIRYLAAGRNEAPTTQPSDSLPVEDTGDPDDWV